MIQTLTIIRFLFPFILIVAFFCLYKKEYRFMKSFMWRMSMYRSGRIFFMSILSLLLIFINWCCCMTEPNIAMAFSSLLTILLIFRRIMESTLHLLHDRKRLWFFTILVAMICYACPFTNSLFHLLFTLCVAAVFYPSERVIRLCENTEYIKKTDEQLSQIAHEYY